MAPRRQRKQKQTVLIYCEGAHDIAFMSHLHSLYGGRNETTNFTIKAGAGGAPVSTVRRSIKVEGDFILRVAKFDNDKGEDALRAAFTEATDTVRVIYCTPAIEATLLEILEPGRSYKTHTTKSCKRRLHSQHMPEGQRLNPAKYLELFPKQLLDRSRRIHERLNRLILIFEQGVEWTGFDLD